MGMDPRLSFVNMSGMILRLPIPRSHPCRLLPACALLILLVSGILPGHAAAQTSDAPRVDGPDQRSDYPRPGIVTTWSHLRTSPSVQSEVVAIAKVGTPVEILTETERWYRVKSAEGVEAWIRKSLVRLEPAPPKVPTATPERVEQPALIEPFAPTTASAEASTDLNEAQPENTADSQNLGLSLSVLGDTLLIPIEELGVGWSLDALLRRVQDLSIYVVPALVLLLPLSLALQLRAARQLRRAMQQVGEIFDIVEEIYANSLMTRAGDRRAIRTVTPRGTSAHRFDSPALEFSSLERAALEAMSRRREISEGELAKILAEQGFTGVLVKEVIANILKKTRASGMPWVEVRHIQGRYRYQLRSDAMSSRGEG